MKLKPGVDDSQTAPVLGLWIGLIAQHHHDWTGCELVVTTLRLESSPWPSLHVVKAGELVRAMAFRRIYLDEFDCADPFCRMLARKYDAWLEVLLEPEWVDKAELERRGGVLQIDPCVHVAVISREWPAGIL